MDLIVGIDIGVNGALALYNPELKKVVTWWGMPNFNTKDGLEEIGRIVKDRIVYIERPLSLKGQNNVSTNINYGIVLSQCILNAKNVIPVMPKKWISHYGLTNDKRGHIRLAKAKNKNTETITHDVSDAILIAYYGAYIEKTKKRLQRV